MKNATAHTDTHSILPTILILISFHLSRLGNVHFLCILEMGEGWWDLGEGCAKNIDIYGSGSWREKYGAKGEVIEGIYNSKKSTRMPKIAFLRL